MKGKMTAVDWLGDVIEVSFDDKRTLSLIKDAKKIERDQIIAAYEQGRRSTVDGSLPVSGKEYYKENY